jgi:amidophosphoribosyltransferase
VRGTTSVKIVQMMRDAGAAEVHMRIASPARPGTAASTASTRPERAKLLAAQMDVAEMATTSTPTASPSCRSTGSTRRSATPARRASARSIATPASPATIRPRSPTRRNSPPADQLRLLAERVRLIFPRPA